jgi:hypothetical protein
MTMTSSIRSLLFAVVCCLCSQTAWAEGWIRYADNDQVDMYFDSFNKRKMGDTAFVWDLHDLKAPNKRSNGFAFQSVGYAVEYQCRAMKRRVLAIKWFSAQMGEGKQQVEEGVVGDWVVIKPGSIEKLLFDHICE